MKHLLICMLVLSGSFAKAEITNNQGLEHCLKTSKYSQVNFNSFNFELAAKCHQIYVAANIDKELKTLDRFLKDNPHYRGDGSGWYKSVEIYTTR